jgi:hypothetical protein
VQFSKHRPYRFLIFYLKEAITTNHKSWQKRNIFAQKGPNIAESDKKGKYTGQYPPTLPATSKCGSLPPAIRTTN